MTHTHQTHTRGSRCNVFPIEARVLAIASFCAIGTATGGITGPLVFANMVETGEPLDTAIAFSIGATLILIAGVIALFLSWDAERNRSKILQHR